MTPATLFSMLRETVTEWFEHKAPRLGAALAFYSIFSIAPLLILAIAVAGAVFGEQAARGQVHEHLTDLVGPISAHAVEEMLRDTSTRQSSTWATVLGLAMLLFGASGVFAQLQDSLNTIWEVTPKPGWGIWATIRDRFLSFAMVLIIGFLLLASLVITAILQAITAYLDVSPLALDAQVWGWINMAVSFVFLTVLFAMIYKILPDVRLDWADVWTGSLITTVLFLLGKYFIAWYLSHAVVTSAYGAAGSLVVLLLWIYYSSQVILFGAVFTRVHAGRRGRHVEPTEKAVPVTHEAQARQGMARREDLEAAADGSS